MATAIEQGLIVIGVSVSVAIGATALGYNPFSPEAPMAKFNREWKQNCLGKPDTATVFVKNQNGIDVQMGCRLANR